MQAPAVVLFARGTAPLEVRVGDDVVATFKPTHSAPEGTGPALSIAAYEALVAACGYDDDGETSPRYEAEGRAAMQEALPPDSMLTPVRTWRGEVEARLRQAEAIGRSYGMSASAIEAVVGRPFVARRSLLPPMARARELDAQRTVAEEQAAVAVAIAAPAKPRTAAELGIDGVAVRLSRLGIVAPEPFPGARTLWVSAEERFYGWLALPGMRTPTFDRDGVRSLRADELVPLDAQRVLEPGWAELHWLRARRAEAGLDFGAMTDFANDVSDVAREFVAKHAGTVLAPPYPRAWIVDYVVEVLVRAAETRLRPDLAAELLLGAMDGVFKAQHAPFNTPTATAGMVHALRNSPITHFSQLVTPAIELKASKPHPRYLPEELPSHACRANIAARCVQAAMHGEFVAVAESLRPASATVPPDGSAPAKNKPRSR